MSMMRTLAIKRLFAMAVATFMLTTPLMAMALPTGTVLTAGIDLPIETFEGSRGYVDRSEWPMFLYGPGHDGHTSSPVPKDNGTIWEVAVGEGIETSPVVVNNTVYIVTITGAVRTYNASTGKGIWYKDIGTASYSTPAISGDYFLVGNWDGEMVALNMSTGSEEWRVDVGSYVNSSPIIVNDLVYFGADDGKVWAYNLTDGKHIWNATVSLSVDTSPAYADDVLLVSYDNALQAFNATDGTPLWTNTTAGTRISGPLARGHSTTPFSWLTYVTSNDGKVYAFNISNGDLRWSSSISYHDLQVPTGGGSLIFVAGQNDVMCFNYSDGSWYWNYTVSGNITTPIVLGGGDLLAGLETGLDAANYATFSGGPQTWTYDLADPNPPALAYGRAFVTTADGDLVAFGHRPVAVIDSITPAPVPLGDPLTLAGHGTGSDAYTNYRWHSDIDGLMVEGSSKSTVVVHDLSVGTHEISFMVQDDNWTWSVPETATTIVGIPVDWPMFRQNPHHTASADNMVPVTNGTKWIVDLTGPLENQDVQSSPIIVDDMAFVGTRDSFIHALNVTTGETIWAFKAGGPVDSTPVHSGGYIYFGSSDTRLYCMDADPYDDGVDEGVLDSGASYDLIWSFDSNGPIWSSPIVVNKVAYFTTSPAVDPFNPNPSRLYAVSTIQGVAQREIWHFTLPNNAPSYSSPLVYEDLVVFGANDNRVYAVNRTTGLEEWNLTTGDSIRSSPAVANDLIYIGSNDNKIYAIHANNGSLAWAKPTDGAVQSSPAISDGVVYVGSMDNKLYAFDAIDGTPLWNYETGDGILSSPAVVPGFVLFGSFDGYLHVVNTTSHNLFWKRNVGAVAQSSPSVAGETVLIGSSRGYLYAFGKAPDLAIEDGGVTFSISTPQVGTPVTITAKVTNKGTIRGNGTVNFFDGTDRVGTGQFVDIGPGMNQNVSVDWQPTIPGNHIITINLTNIRPHDSDPVNNQLLEIIKVLEQTEGWRMFQKDEKHNGMLDVATPNNNEVLWTYDFAGNIRSSPLVADSLVFIGSSDGIHSFVEEPPGKTGFIFQENTTIKEVEATPAIVSGVVYAPSVNDGNLYAIDAWNGKTLWTAHVSTGTSSPIVVNNTVFIGNTNGELVAVHALNGSIIWNAPVGGEITSSPAVYEDFVILGNEDGQSSVVNAYDINTGDLVWSFPTGFNVRSSPAIDEDGFVYIGDSNGTIYKLEAIPDFKDDGIPNSGKYDLIWAYFTLQPVHSTIAISGNNLYFTAGNTSIWSLSTDGTRNWKEKRNYAQDEGKVIVSSPAIAENKIFVGGDKIYCLDTTTGLEIWNHTTAASVTASPAITLGKVFFASEAGTVYAFGNITLKPPVAVITSPTASAEFREGEEITFDASGSMDDGVILDYLWDFGDEVQETGDTAKHSYDNIGNYTVTLTVKDNEIPPFSDNTSITVHIIQNAAPSISSPIVTPTEGNLSTDFEFSVAYGDPDNDPPLFVKVTVGGLDYYLEQANPNATDYISGVLFSCSTRVPSGNHTYSFRASDGVLEASPLTGVGPKVWQVSTFTRDEVTVIMEYVGQGQLEIYTPSAGYNPPEENMTQKDIFGLRTILISEWKWMWLGLDSTGRNFTTGVKEDTLMIYLWNGTFWKALETTLELNNNLTWTNISWTNISLGDSPTLVFGLFAESTEKNRPPKDLAFVKAPNTRFVDENVVIQVSAIDDDGDTLYYRIDWGDGNADLVWGTQSRFEHKYKRAGSFTIMVYVNDEDTADLSTPVSAITHTISIRDKESSDALIALAVIIFIVLAVAFAVPIRGGKDEDEEEEEEEEDEEEEEEDEEIPEDEEEEEGKDKDSEE